MQEQIDRASVARSLKPVDAARVSSWLAATGEATVTGQHAALASPSDATSSMQQPQTLREGELLRAEAAEGQLVDLQGHFNALLQVLSRRC